VRHPPFKLCVFTEMRKCAEERDDPDADQSRFVPRDPRLPRIVDNGHRGDGGKRSIHRRYGRECCLPEAVSLPFGTQSSVRISLIVLKVVFDVNNPSMSIAQSQYRWRIVAEDSWYILGECYWYIIGCSVTGSTCQYWQFCLSSIGREWGG
jgi:hypothetical protein